MSVVRLMILNTVISLIVLKNKVGRRQRARFHWIGRYLHVRRLVRYAIFILTVGAMALFEPQ